MALPAEISVAELERMRAAEADFVLVDVREDDEVATASLPFARHIAMGSIPARLAEIPQHADVVVMCHSGYRSDNVARYLRANGYSSVANLAGGIDAWSVEIDRAVPRY